MLCFVIINSGPFHFFCVWIVYWQSLLGLRWPSADDRTLKSIYVLSFDALLPWRTCANSLGRAGGVVFVLWRLYFRTLFATTLRDRTWSSRRTCKTHRSNTYTSVSFAVSRSVGEWNWLCSRIRCGSPDGFGTQVWTRVIFFKRWGVLCGWRVESVSTRSEGDSLLGPVSSSFCRPGWAVNEDN